MQTSPRRYQQIQREDRVTIARLLQQNNSLRDIAAVLNRSPSTISRERQRNVAKAVGIAPVSPYASVNAQRSCQQRRRAGRPLNKLHPVRPMFEVTRHLLAQSWSPEQITLTLAALYPKGHGYRVSTETIYNCIYAQSVGELKRELVACLRHAHNKRVPRSKGQDRRVQIPDMLSIHVRPPEIEDRHFPGHWEGDLIKGEGNASAVGTLVERTDTYSAQVTTRFISSRNLRLRVRLVLCSNPLSLRVVCSMTSSLHCPCQRGGFADVL